MIIEIVPGKVLPKEWEEGRSSNKRRKRHEASMKPYRSRPIRLEYLVHSDESLVRVADALDKRFSAFGGNVERKENVLRLTTCLSSPRNAERVVRRIVKRHKDQPVQIVRNPLEWMRQYGRVGKYRRQQQTA